MSIKPPSLHSRSEVKSPRGIPSSTSPTLSFSSVHTQPWPKFDVSKILSQDVTIAIQVNGKLRDTITVSAPLASIQNDIETEAKKQENIQKYLAGKTVRKIIFIPAKLINFVI